MYLNLIITSNEKPICKVTYNMTFEVKLELWQGDLIRYAIRLSTKIEKGMVNTIVDICWRYFSNIC